MRRRGAPALRAVAIGASLLVAGTTSLQNAVANGDTRTLTMHHTHSGENGTFTFKKNGRYDPDELEKLNYFLRDWRNQKPTKMDPQLFDIVWEVYRETDATAPIQIVSAFRSPETNSMLRARSSGVAKFSQHMLGRAMDFYIPGVNLTELRVAGLRLQRGGVGFYPTSGSPFVHMDTGSIRHWPRMTHDQLARVFPDGKTVHVPTDGRPLSNYNAALAEVQSRGAKPGVAFAESTKGGKSLLASLFGKKGADDDEGGENAPAAAPATATAQNAGGAAPDAAASERTRIMANLPARPLPPSRPAEIAMGALVTAQAASGSLLAPFPARRPPEADTGRNTRLASLTAPKPLTSAAAREAALAAAIARGLEEDTDPALGYAMMGPHPRERNFLAGGLMTHAAAYETPAPPVTGGRTRQKVADAGVGPMLMSPTLSSQSYMRSPEVRRLSDLMEPAHTKVALMNEGAFRTQYSDAGRPAPAPAAAPLAYARRM